MSNLDVSEMADQVLKAIKKEYQSLKTLNVMVLGKTGVGKSTLINQMFNENLVDTGVGKPVTKKIRKIAKNDFPLAIYDTPGLELKGENSVNNLQTEIVEEIQKGIKTGDIGEMIHCLWYCIATPSHRLEEGEVQFLKHLGDKLKEFKLPLIVVLTQSYSKNDAKALMEEIAKENLPIAKIIPVLAQDFVIDDEYVKKAYGLEQLAEIMNDVVPEGVKKTFIAVQKANLKLKKRRARSVVTSSALAAAATGAIPIPFSDAAILVPEQVAMLGGITAVFGIPIEKASLVAIISATVGTLGTTTAGRSIFANVIKFIPGAGSIVGGAISGSTAAALTAALGEAYIVLMVKIYQGELHFSDLTTEKGKAELQDIFKNMLKVKRDSKGKPKDEKK